MSSSAGFQKLAREGLVAAEGLELMSRLILGQILCIWPPLSWRIMRWRLRIVRLFRRS